MASRGSRDGIAPSHAGGSSSPSRCHRPRLAPPPRGRVIGASPLEGAMEASRVPMGPPGGVMKGYSPRSPRGADCPSAPPRGRRGWERSQGEFGGVWCRRKEEFMHLIFKEKVGLGRFWCCGGGHVRWLPQGTRWNPSTNRTSYPPPPALKTPQLPFPLNIKHINSPISLNPNSPKLPKLPPGRSMSFPEPPGS
jgi:hypothetical protein